MTVSSGPVPSIVVLDSVASPQPVDIERAGMLEQQEEPEHERRVAIRFTRTRFLPAAAFASTQHKPSG